MRERERDGEGRKKGSVDHQQHGHLWTIIGACPIKRNSMLAYRWRRQLSWLGPTDGSDWSLFRVAFYPRVEYYTSRSVSIINSYPGLGEVGLHLSLWWGNLNCDFGDDSDRVRFNEHRFSPKPRTSGRSMRAGGNTAKSWTIDE